MVSRFEMVERAVTAVASRAEERTERSFMVAHLSLVSVGWRLWYWREEELVELFDDGERGA